MVDDEYIFIEIETNNKYTNIEELKEIINKYNLPIAKTNYFVKKAEIMLKKVLKDKETLENNTSSIKE